MDEEEEFEFRLRMEREKSQSVAEPIEPQVLKEPVKNIPQEFSTGEMVSNIPSSGKQFFKDITYPFVHPIETGKAIGKLAIGTAGKITGDAMPGSVAKEYEPLADAVGQFYKDRYGSWDATKQTLMKDPVGALADTAGVLTGAGAVTKAALPARVGNVGQNISKVAAAIEPANIAINTAKTAYGAIPKTAKGHIVDSIMNLAPRHRNRAGRALNEIAGDDAPEIIRAMENPREIVPGSVPTAGQAASDVGSRKFAAIESLMEGREPTAHGRLMDSQRLARARAIEDGIAKTPDEYKAAVNTRKRVTDPLYTAARSSETSVDVVPVVTRIDKLIAENPGNKRLLKEMKALKDGLTTKDGIPRTNAKEVISSIEGLKTTMANQKNAFIKKELTNIKHSLIDSVPEYKFADEQFRLLSKPINQMDIGKQLANDISPIVGDAEGVNKFANALENARLTIKKSTGDARFNKLEDVLSPEQMTILGNVKSELDRAKNMSSYATKGRKAMQSKLDTALRPIEAPPMLSTKMMVLRKIMSRLKGGATEKTLDYLAERQFNPQEWAAIMKEATPEERSIINLMDQSRKRAPVAEALFQSGRAAQEMENR